MPHGGRSAEDGGPQHRALAHLHGLEAALAGLAAPPAARPAAGLAA